MPAVAQGAMGLSGARIYAEVGEIFGGTKPVPVSDTTIFKSVGLAIEDLATARLVYDATRARRSGAE
jgi:thiomorpholine-carboxylate dehydrogenase